MRSSPSMRFVFQWDTTGTVTNMSLAEPTIVSVVATNFPPYWPTNSRIRFFQVEVLFSKQGITISRTMYKETVRALPTEYATEVQDLLFDPPDEQPYKKLKEQLIVRITDSKRQKFRQLLTAVELEDCKPTQLLCLMQLLLGEKAKIIESSLLRKLFLQCLPSNVQMILAPANTMTIDKLTEMVMVLAISAPPFPPSADPQKVEISEVTFRKRLQQHCRHRICHPDFPWSGIEEVGTVHISIPIRMANCLRNNRQSKREPVGTINNLVQNAQMCCPPCSAGNAGASL